jgi:hypothetical protein
VKITLFTAESANRLLPTIRPQLEELKRLKGELDRAQSRVEVLELAVAGAAPSNPDMRERESLIERRKLIADRIQGLILKLQRTGCHLKDLDTGLVDFYSLAGDRLVFLCWRLGEPEVSHWHTLDGGFANRQRLDRSELE